MEFLNVDLFRRELNEKTTPCTVPSKHGSGGFHTVEGACTNYSEERVAIPFIHDSNSLEHLRDEFRNCLPRRPNSRNFESALEGRHLEFQKHEPVAAPSGHADDSAVRISDPLGSAPDHRFILPLTCCECDVATPRDICLGAEKPARIFPLGGPCQCRRCHCMGMNGRQSRYPVPPPPVC